MARTLLALVLWTVLPGMAQSPWLVPYGAGGCGGGNAFVPTFHSAGEFPLIGRSSFRLVSENLVGGAPGFFLLSPNQARFPILGMTVLVDPTITVAIGCQAGGSAWLPGAGRVEHLLWIPGNGSLVGGRVFIQGFFYDRYCPSTLIYTHGLEVTIDRAVSPIVAALHDRLKYQALFAGSTAQQAESLGRAIWAEKQVAGFGYLRTEPFVCGGESHWMVIVQHLQTRLEFCLIPGGSFLMGDTWLTGSSAERPSRWVRVPAFLLARTELPQAAWRPVMGSDPSPIQGPDLPLHRVAWQEAQKFCSWTNLRLPSEAEWEYACRAGVDRCFHFDEIYSPAAPTNLGPYAWYDANSGLAPNPVGRKLPNAFGLFDMHGNVSEWCADGYYGTHRCAPTDGSPWPEQTPPNHLERPARGGAYSSPPSACRASSRFGAGYMLSTIGFRPAGPSLR